MSLNIYLSGEIHTNWRQIIIDEVGKRNLNVNFSHPVLDHQSSDDCGVQLLGSEEKKFWYDHKGAKVNALRTQHAIKKCDIVIVRFGEKYKQWNAAYDAGYAVALGKSLIVIHGKEHQHALKEVDAFALAVLDDPLKIVDVLSYVINGTLEEC